MSWYALKSRDELFTADMLRQAGYLAYVPCETVERKVNRRLAWIQRPICPGYLFVHCSEGSFGAVRAVGSAEDFIRGAPDALGVRHPIRLANNALVPVVLAEAYGDFDHSRQPPPWEPSRHDTVRITAGLWKGYLGTITSIGKKKVLVETKWCKLEIPAGELELAA